MNVNIIITNMKRIIKIATLAFAVLLISADVSAQSLSDLLKGLGQGQSTTQTDSSSSRKGGLSDVLSGVAGALGLGNSKAGIDQLAGTWAYSSPAVSFKSDNLLLKAGGAAAAANVEKKLEPYYKTAGLTSLVITINADSTFTFKGRRASLNGNIERQEKEGTYVFHFQAFKKINIGSMEAFISLNGKNNMTLTFDITKLMTLMQRISALSSSSTLKGASTLLSKYDGMTAGFDLRKTADAAPAGGGKK